MAHTMFPSPSSTATWVVPSCSPWPVSLEPPAGVVVRELDGLDNVVLVVGDGTLGWPDLAPYDAITVGATGPQVPPALLEQLADGGRLVIPVGPPNRSSLQRWVRRGTESVGPEQLMQVRFVPLIGEAGFADED